MEPWAMTALSWAATMLMRFLVVAVRGSAVRRRNPPRRCTEIWPPAPGPEPGRTSRRASAEASRSSSLASPRGSWARSGAAFRRRSYSWESRRCWICSASFETRSFVRGKRGLSGLRRAAEQRGKCRSRPVSRVLSRGKPHGGEHSSRTRVAARLQRAVPGGSGGPPFTSRRREDASLFALAPGGVCRAAPVARRAVRSYRTVSPLPRACRHAVRRSVLCGTFLRVAPTGC